MELAQPKQHLQHHPPHNFLLQMFLALNTIPDNHSQVPPVDELHDDPELTALVAIKGVQVFHHELGLYSFKNSNLVLSPTHLLLISKFDLYYFDGNLNVFYQVESQMNASPCPFPQFFYQFVPLSVVFFHYTLI